VAAMAANQYEYEDDYEEQDNGPAELRKALKKAQKEREAIEAELTKMRSELRARSVKDVLASKGVPDKLAKLIPSDVDTPEQIDSWLTEYSDVFGLQAKQEESVEPTVDEETIKSNQRINQSTSTAQIPSGEQNAYQKVMGAKSKEELDQMIFGQSLGR
jgi:predicted ATP-dependent protease